MRSNRRSFGFWALLSPVFGFHGCGSSVSTYDDKLTPGILLEEDRAVLPAGEALRAIPEKALRLTKVSEGWVPKLYNDAAGFCTVGYGHLAYRSRCDGKTPKEFLGGISEEEGTRLLLVDMARAQVAVQLAIRNHEKLLNDTQFGALCDFVFNVGAGNFNTSTLLKVIKEKRFDSVPTQFRRWVLADGKPFKGLKQRREREIELFFDGLTEPKGVPRAEEETSSLDIRPKGI